MECWGEKTVNGIFSSSSHRISFSNNRETHTLTHSRAESVIHFANNTVECWLVVSILLCPVNIIFLSATRDIILNGYLHNSVLGKDLVSGLCTASVL